MFRRALGFLVVLYFVMIGPVAFAASPVDLPEAPDAKSPSKPVSIYEERPINWRSIVPDVLHDQRNIWTFPTKLARGEDWKPTLEFTAVLGGLIALDSRDAPRFRQTTAFSTFNRAASGTNVAVATLAIPAAFYAVGLVRKDSYATHTALLAGEALVDSEILSYVMKTATGRRRPYEIPSGGNYNDTWFETYHPVLNSNGSFPSGHTIAAFSVATVIAHRYGGNHRWVPWVAYGAATLAGFSRLTLQEHFPSDVFASAAFGYIISRFIVMPGREPEY